MVVSGQGGRGFVVVVDQVAKAGHGAGPRRCVLLLLLLLLLLSEPLDGRLCGERTRAGGRAAVAVGGVERGRRALKVVGVERRLNDRVVADEDGRERRLAERIERRAARPRCACCCYCCWLWLRVRCLKMMLLLLVWKHG